MYFNEEKTRHCDADLMMVRPPTAGSEGLALTMDQVYWEGTFDLFKENEWNVVRVADVNTAHYPLAICGGVLSNNFINVSPNCVIIEEHEVALYHFFEDHGFDVITIPFRHLNEHGGGIHCNTWDIRRDDECKDYFPNQNYEEVVNRDPMKCLNRISSDF